MSSKKRKRQKEYFGQGADRTVWNQVRVTQYIHVRPEQLPGPVTITHPDDHTIRNQQAVHAGQLDSPSP